MPSATDGVASRRVATDHRLWSSRVPGPRSSASCFADWLVGVGRSVKSLDEPPRSVLVYGRMIDSQRLPRSRMAARSVARSTLIPSDPVEEVGVHVLVGVRVLFGNDFNMSVRVGAKVNGSRGGLRSDGLRSFLHSESLK